MQSNPCLPNITQVEKARVFSHNHSTRTCRYKQQQCTFHPPPPTPTHCHHCANKQVCTSASFSMHKIACTHVCIQQGHRHALTLALTPASHIRAKDSSNRQQQLFARLPRYWNTATTMRQHSNIPAPRQASMPPHPSPLSSCYPPSHAWLLNPPFL